MTVDLSGKNEKIVSQLQHDAGDRQELLSELWTNNIGLIQKNYTPGYWIAKRHT